MIQKENKKNYETDMLLIQGKIKVISQESTIQKNYNNKKNKVPLNYINDKQINNKKNIDYNQKKYFYLNEIENKNDFIKCAKYFLKTINLT